MSFYPPLCGYNSRLSRTRRTCFSTASKMTTTEKHRSELMAGQRFEFGQNWTNFLGTLNEARIDEAVESLKRRLGVVDLRGKSFLDIGSGSGLFSLAAAKLGAVVTSFDFDPKSVACTDELRRRSPELQSSWRVFQGSILDKAWVENLGTFDVVYSWGVLHHTGAMWDALANAERRVAANGRLFVAIYNDQGGASRRWLVVKKIYNKLPGSLQTPFAVVFYAPIEIRSFLIHLVRGKPLAYFRYIRDYGRNRGMSWWHDKIDWIGGLPFEVAQPEEVFDFYRTRGFVLDRLVTCAGGLGCNEFVFTRTTSASASGSDHGTT